ncbi:hypothetical protein S40288_10636 [Stachybotrys chartarum IBT 40288]|nr:hypothetical protein S40288_10636 [Stachybotrys chartarum IBT 40288]
MPRKRKSSDEFDSMPRPAPSLQVGDATNEDHERPLQFRDDFKDVYRASVSLHFAVALAGQQRFAPHFSPRQGPTTVMDIEAEEPARNAGHAGALMARGLLGTLRYASWRCGCRALEAESITFRFLLPARPDQSQVDVEMEEKKITSAYGRIEVLETAIMQGPRAATKWLWFRITKSVFRCRGRAPEGLDGLPDSWVVFAIPLPQVEKIEEA